MIEQDPPPATQRQPLAIVTIVMIAANLAAYVFSVASGANWLAPDPEVMFNQGGNFGVATLDGESWRLVSSMFLHYGLIHLAMNMLGLVFVGIAVERFYGRLAYLALYLFSGLVGSLTTALGSHAISVGASGPLFGLLGGFGAYLLIHRASFDKEAFAKQTRWLGIVIAINVVTGLQSKTVDMYAHIGGLVAGLGAGFVLAKRPSTARVVSVFAASIVLVAVVTAGVIPKPPVKAVLATTKAKFDDFAKLEERALGRYNQLVGNDKMTEDEVANAIELEVLPVWRQGKTLVWSIEYLPDELEANLHAYIETRERAWVAMIGALRKRDQAALADALNAMGDAEKYVEKLKQ